MTNDLSSQILDKTLEAELRSPRVLGWSVIIKDNQPVYNNNILKNKIKPPISTISNNNINDISSSLNSSSYSSLLSLSSSKYFTNNINNNDLNNDLNNNDINNGISSNNIDNIDDISNIIKKDFSIWRCLFYPEIAANPIYSFGYGKMRLALCLNKIITSLIEKNFLNSNENDHIELLPYIRIFYDEELLFQSCIVNKNICIILEIDIHHPLSNIIIQVFDFDDSDPSIINNFDDCIGQLIIPIGIHSNRKPLENTLVIGIDDEARLLFTRKLNQKKVMKNNLTAQKLLRFPIKSYDKNEISRNYKSIDEYYDLVEEEELQVIDDKILNKNYNQHNNELPNIIYYEIANQMVKDAIELSHNAEIKYKNINKLQNSYYNFVIQIYSEIKWTRFSIIPREIFALYLPESNLKSKSSIHSSDNSNFDINIKIIINSIIVLKELYYSTFIHIYINQIFKLYNCDSYLLSLFILSIIWYILFNPKYIYSIILFIIIYILYNNFYSKNQFIYLKNSISSKLTNKEVSNNNINNLIESKNNSPMLINQEIFINNHTEDLNLNSNNNNNNNNNNDYTILETLLTSSALSSNSIYYIKKLSLFLDQFTRFMFNIIKLIYWYNVFKSFMLFLFSIIFLFISLIYPKEFCKYMQYTFLLIFILSSAFFLPPIKGLFRIINSYKQYRKLKKRINKNIK